ncbi:efflux transporter periplasmic adaptor subunit [Elizabethkingia meningoseptica]|uniref:Efflux transporter periplasmic adaptor subunit n=1 Tax=Elizabethkingia meningoseptica TaxID=238 RepID=A0A1V3U3P2_ELIME|nr:efflux RND transporter periplasmic adaptor subunit [Elizabethkingia meningoseptica]EOR28935.1 RND family efflux transporter MFP subunit [Elizabethkingia meningoseptica ATCC 13253 = NBRC 12535]AQX06833.1 efflux transporter periplasmic adaptor subunit [Elizabethkingia meningoseptica]AQX11087.1 efflux transporter periplasmic adaptor subunit [Elizabethkingia meningoseptica]AQX48879.1 efflux transporter periplasmic adaptor subunit [Elizabethkingia meningoseptica]EJK5330387.1 efflux RND transport
MYKNFILKSSFIISAALILSSCGKGDNNQAYNQQPPELPIGVVTQQDVTIPREYATSIEGISTVEIRPQVSGYLSRIFVDEGDYVRAGQVLFKIEDRIFQEQLRSAQATLVSANAALATANIELNRKKELAKNNMVSSIQVKEAETAYNSARGSVSQAQAAIESSKINLNFAAIKAPVSGYIGRFKYRIGSLLSPTNADPITILSDIHQVYAYFSLSENDFVNFQNQHPGNTIEEKLKNTPAVNLILSNGEQYETSGRINAVEGQFNKTTGAITMRAVFDNSKSTLRSGNTGKIVLEQKYPNATLLPVASTMMIQDKVYVFSLDKQNKAIQIPVEVAGKAGTNYIVTNGLKAGDRYIVTGFERLQPGTPVVPQKEQKKDQKKAQ